MNYKEWEQFLAPYKQAVEELKVKLKGIRSQFELRGEHSPIEFVTGRVKPVPSILDKAKRKQIPLDKIEEEMQDIAGLRMMCQFVGDIQLVVQMLRDRHDLEIVEERDYITRNKESGYRSYHCCGPLPSSIVRRIEKGFG
ncbi:ppGpp synthetase/RelA/SpoT-type nucleotidyltransferase [Aeribacillus sp. SP014]